MSVMSAEHVVVQVPDSECGRTYPQMYARWEPQSGIGWRAVVTFYRAEGDACAHEIYLGITSPVTYLHMSLDAYGYGCLASHSVPFADLTVRDMVWAAWWAFAEIRHAHATCPHLGCKERYERRKAGEAGGGNVR